MTEQAALTLPSAPNPSIRPISADALWKLLSKPHPTVGKARHLGEALVQAGLISTTQLEAGLLTQHQERNSGTYRRIGQILVDSGALTEEQLSQVIATWLGDYTVHPGDIDADPAAISLVPQALAERESVLPLLAREDALVLLMADPSDRDLLGELRFLTQRRIIALRAAPGSLMPAIHKAYGNGSGHSVSVRPSARATSQELLDNLATAAPDLDANQADVISESDNTLVRLINSLIDEAIQHRASDIHIETEQAPNNVRIRLRIDGDLKPYLILPARYRFAIVARIKIMANMDISEHRKPQDGKINFARFGGPAVELRVVTVPTTHGLEDVVLRLLAGAKPLPIDKIGLSQANLDTLRQVVQKSYGLILVCGPTGCGKTTTLHSVVSDINIAGRKIWTAEDPIEITQEGLRQVQVNPRIGWTFAAAMRTFLRADPDVIMIGEMRDEETARIAIEASLTGHLVLSTLHTNSAPESIARLLEIGLDPFNFSDSLLAILAQRLVRRLCKACCEPHLLDAKSLEDLASQYLSSGTSNTPESRKALIARWSRVHGDAQGQLHTWRRVGCPQCEFHGYRGRLGIHELMLSDDIIRQHIRQRAPASDIRHSALAAGMRTLRQDGIEKVLEGLTDMTQVLAATNL